MSATCTHNPATGRLACGQSFGGELQHCVAPVSWSRFTDGLAHVTASLGLIEWLWRKGGGEPADPASLGCTQDATGRWRRPISDEQRAALAARRAAP